MQIIVKSCHGVSVVPLESRLLAERKIYLQGEINDISACEFEQKLDYLLGEDSEDEINLYINSPGGVVTAGLQIYDIIKSINAPMNMWCRGIAASMAAIIFAGGQKGRRFILPHSKVMIHEPLIQGSIGGSASSIHRTAESIMETRKLTIELLAADTGKSRSAVEKAIAFDNYMNAQEAVEFGIADEVVCALR